LPGSLEQGNFLVALDRLAVRSHLRILSVVPGKAAADEGRHCLPVKLQLTGNYFSLLHFLQGLQQGERLVVINSLTVKQGKDREDALTAELGLSIFSVPDE
jgi:type IV pilus assembly protein PilO